jgi:hypothetical protein
VSLQELSRDTHPNPPERDARCRERLTCDFSRCRSAKSLNSWIVGHSSIIPFCPDTPSYGQSA